jgi:D-3-phosphoglycerate dehydrogenase
MYKVLTLNNISVAGLERFPRARYELASELPGPDAVMVRSADMHSLDIADSIVAIGRAGAGVNNIPVDRCSERGIAVFNAPGANANAVKELVLAGILLASRNIGPAWAYAQSLEGDGTALDEVVEQGKKRFVGTELPGRTLGVIGLGNIGVLVANAARGLGMQVVGHDPQMTVDRAWQLEASVRSAQSVDEVLAQSDFVTLHVPLVEQTRNLINARRIATMKPGAIVLNFSRAGIVNNGDVVAALGAGRLRGYVCDFPARELMGVPGVIALPHLGASTHEAQDNCAIMVADQICAFLEHGTVTNAVNLPDAHMPRGDGVRLAAVHANVPNMLGQLSTLLANANLNIVDMLNRSHGALAYTLLDVEGSLPDGLLDDIKKIEGIKRVRSPA